MVASFSILGDLVQNVGGDRVSVTTLVGPDGDVHVYTPAPTRCEEDRRRADSSSSTASAWRAGCRGWCRPPAARPPIVTATDGHRAAAGRRRVADPHAWQSVANAKIYVANIRDALVAADPADAAVFRANAQAYLAKLDALDGEVRAAVARIPPSAPQGDLDP